ncbi:MAG: amidase [Acinetobacter sp.]
MSGFKKTLLFVSLSSLLAACNDSNESNSSAENITPVPFNPVEATIADVRRSITSKGANCVSIVQSYLDRIEAYDKKGPTLNSIIAVSPTALQEAKALDDYYLKTGQLKGDLHCVTVLPKDNIDAVDMANTAGSKALTDNFPLDDAYMIKKIKAHGGIILGKANLDEFAFGFGGSSSNPNGGQTKNVYDLSKGPGGSSAGTGAAINASLALIGIGTDTGGSIRIPSAVQGLVGLRPSLRLVSQDGIIPLAPTQDTAGPMCRKAIDCAILMNSLTGYDAATSSNQRNDFDRLSPLVSSAAQYKTMYSVPESYVPAATESLQGKRIGIVKAMYAQPNSSGVMTEDGTLVNQAMEQAIAKLTAAGATVEVVEINDLSKIFSTYSSLSSYEFKTALTVYLQSTQSIFKSYADLQQSGLMIATFNNYDRDPTAQTFIDGYALNTTTRAPHVRGSLNSALDNTDAAGEFKGLSYDALAYPTMTALASDLGKGPSAGTNNRLSPFSGFPALSMPAASVTSTRSTYPMNVNIEFIAREFDEPTLFKIAVAFEQVNPARQVPVHTPAL